MLLYGRLLILARNRGLYVGLNKTNCIRYNSSWKDTLETRHTVREAGDSQDNQLFNDLVKEVDAKEKRNDDSFDDIFKDIILDPKQPSSEAKTEMDKIFANISRGQTSEKQELYQDTSMDIDMTDETLVLDKKAEDPNIVQKEKELFMNIFKTYSQREPSKEKKKSSHSNLLWNLREAMSSKSTDLDRHISRAMRPSQGNKLTQDTIDRIFLHFDDSLKPTYTALLTFDLRESYLDFLKGVIQRFKGSRSRQREFFLTMKKGEALHDFTDRFTKLSQEVKLKNEELPLEPVLNAYTLPLLFNYILKTLITKFYDGQLALTLFNSLKRDLDVYTVVCNQDTYNEVLKLFWAYYGKLSLQEIEMTFLEMKNNGFVGNLNTFRVLKEIIVRYHLIKLGLSDLTLFWLREDDKRVKNLERNLHKLASQLKAI